MKYNRSLTKAEGVFSHPKNLKQKENAGVDTLDFGT